MENFNELDNISFVDSKRFNAKAYKGFKTTIASIKELEAVDWYTGPKDDTGKPTFNAQSTAKKKIIEIESAKLPEMDEKGKPTDKLSNISVKRRFNLKKEIGQNGETIWGISKDPKGKLWAFMRNLEAKKLSELINKEIVIAAIADKDDENKFWLRISD